MACFLSSFLLTTRGTIILSSGARRNYQISFFKLVFTSAFRAYFPMFSQMLFLLVKKWKLDCHGISS